MFNFYFLFAKKQMRPFFFKISSKPIEAPFLFILSIKKVDILILTYE